MAPRPRRRGPSRHAHVRPWHVVRRGAGYRAHLSSVTTNGLRISSRNLEDLIGINYVKPARNADGVVRQMDVVPATWDP